jgi:hypothetical protein
MTVTMDGAFGLADRVKYTQSKESATSLSRYSSLSSPVRARVLAGNLSSQLGATSSVLS